MSVYIGKVCKPCDVNCNGVPVIDLQSEVSGSFFLQVHDQGSTPENPQPGNPTWSGKADNFIARKCGSDAHIDVGWTSDTNGISHNQDVYIP
jgi:hypothetical protein